MLVKDIYSEMVNVISPDATLKDAVEKMVSSKTNTLVAVDQAGKFMGIVTSKEIILAVLPDFLEDKNQASLAGDETFDRAVKEAAGLKVSDFMNTKISPVTLETSVIKVAVNVLYQNESRLPVVDSEGKVIGIVTRTNIKRAVARVLGIEKK